MPRSPRLIRGRRIAAAAAALGVSLALTGCGFDAQTLQPYTPAEGVNIATGSLLARNILVIADSAGQGRLSASLMSRDKADTLTTVTGSALKTDGSTAGPLTIGAANVALPAGKLVVLTADGAAPISVSGTGLKPGSAAKLRFQYGSGVTQELEVPVVDAANPIYASLAPKAPAATATATTAPTATAAPTAASASATPGATPSK